MPTDRTLRARTEQALANIVTQLPGYEPRPQQYEMARAIADAMDEGRHALIEAGTGSGKSFAYLLPLLESGRKAVIATGTIALQEQLLHKDIPFLCEAYGREIPVALAKGRSNYVCLRKLHEMRFSLPTSDPMAETVEELIQLHGTGQWSGDRAELPFMVEGRFWADALAADAEDCIGPRCPNALISPHRVAREALDDAQIIIANHALYLTDVARGSAVLPQHDFVVFDEAHHLDRAAVSAFAIQVSRWESGKLLQRLQRRFSALPLKLTQECVDAEFALTDWLYQRGRGQFKLECTPLLGETAHRLSQAYAAISHWLSQASSDQMTLLEQESAAARAQAESLRDQMLSVASDLAHRWEHFAVLREGDEVANWSYVDPGRDYFELTSAPLEVGDRLSETLWSQRTCILTSATLAVDGRFDYLRRELGLPTDTVDRVLGSPFEYQRQALLYVPRNIPAPSDPTFLDEAAREIERLLAMSRGRAFVLCTSYRSLRELSGLLRPRIPWPTMTQEELPRARLIEWFKATPNAVLFGTGTFWEGVDIPGDALSCVIIDKLPFASPDDPVVQARTERMKARNEDWFNTFMLPKAVLALKQGFGRLIRTRSDTGLVAILDRRLWSMRYGEVVLRSLPPARRLSRLFDTLEMALAEAPETAPRWGYTSEPGLRSVPELGPEAPVSRWNVPPPDLDAVLGPPLDG